MRRGEKNGVAFIEVEKYRDETSKIALFTTVHLAPVAKLAVSMLERWGCVTADTDGEDSAGRQKWKHQDVKVLVKKACDIAEEAFKEFRERDWVLDIPVPKILGEEEEG